MKRNELKKLINNNQNLASRCDRNCNIPRGRDGILYVNADLSVDVVVPNMNKAEAIREHIKHILLDCGLIDLVHVETDSARYDRVTKAI